MYLKSPITGLVASATMLATPLLFAQTGSGTLTYQPAGVPGAATAVPTLSGMAFIALALALGFVAVRALRAGGPIPAWALAVGLGALVSSGVGMDLVGQSHAELAFSPVQTPLNQEGGGQALIDETACNVFTNATDVAQQILSVAVSQACSRPEGTEVNPCNPGVELDEGGRCTVNCDPNIPSCGVGFSVSG